MNRYSRWTVGALCMAFLVGTAVRAEDKKPADDKKAGAPAPDKKAGDKAPAPGDKAQPGAGDAAKAAMMETMMKAGMPGPEHEMLKKCAGKWKVESTWYMEPGGKGEVSTGEATFDVILDGRFVEQHCRTASAGGPPFEGHGITGYDNTSKKFVNVWFDNMGTGIMQSEGVYDSATKTLTFNGEAMCPVAGKMQKYRMVEKMVDDNHKVFEMYGPDMTSGKEYKCIEVKYTRATGA